VARTVARITDAARAVDGHDALGEAVWLDLDQPRPDSAGFFVDELAYAHVARADNAARDQWALGFVVHPDARDGPAARALLDAAASHVAAHGGGRVTTWRTAATAADDTLLAELGFTRVRALYEMRVPLPLDEQPRWPPGTTVRSFRPGQDEPAWLTVNNRAFAGHAEQGSWTEETLARRTAEPWFDPTIFLLAFDDQGLAGFNWCKIHDARAPDPALGEIFVIGVDPRTAGAGLGRPLAVAGLDAMAGRGITTGMLFCAADNERALRLYRGLGFTVHREDRAYERAVPER
jgi:mycothiol synthase